MKKNSNQLSLIDILEGIIELEEKNQNNNMLIKQPRMVIKELTLDDFEEAFYREFIFKNECYEAQIDYEQLCWGDI